jgi:hypothetical protein
MLEQNMDVMIQYYDFELQLVRLSVVEKTLPVKIGLLVTNSQIEVTLDEMINSTLGNVTISPELEKSLQEMLDLYDLNKNGILEQEELDAANIQTSAGGDTLIDAAELVRVVQEQMNSLRDFGIPEDELKSFTVKQIEQNTFYADWIRAKAAKAAADLEKERRK